MTRIAVLQMTSGIDPEANYACIADAAGKAADEGASTMFTPEMSVLLDRDRKRAAEWIEGEGAREAVERLETIAGQTGTTLAIGSVPLPSGDADGRWANRSLYVTPDEGLVASYDKMHMFDVELASGESWRESAAYRPGSEVVTVEDTPLGRLGLTICYDLRFPALFGALGDRRCDAIAVPAAFTRPTGAAHWHVLLRARAIEASAYVIAAAQVDKHQDGRETYGHSLVVDPWGEVLLDMGGDEAGLGFADIDLARIAEARSQVPSLANRREVAT